MKLKDKLAFWSFRFVSSLLFRGSSPPYWLADLCSWLMRTLFKYRRHVIHHNLDIAFGEQTVETRNLIINSFYQNLSEIIVETIYGYRHPEYIVRHVQFENIELLKKLNDENNNIAILSAHLYNWEWGSMALAHQTEVPLLGVYKKVNNKLFDQYINQVRRGTGMKLVEINKTYRMILRYRTQIYNIGLVADQNPANIEKAQWTDFFGKEVPFLNGPQVLVSRFEFLPVFAHLVRTGRGEYVCRLIRLDPEFDILDQYVKQLEHVISRYPDGWLWSHKRWRHARK